MCFANDYDFEFRIGSVPDSMVACLHTTATCGMSSLADGSMTSSAEQSRLQSRHLQDARTQSARESAVCSKQTFRLRPERVRALLRSRGESDVLLRRRSSLGLAMFPGPHNVLTPYKQCFRKHCRASRPTSLFWLHGCEVARCCFSGVRGGDSAARQDT